MLKISLWLITSGVVIAGAGYALTKLVGSGGAVEGPGGLIADQGRTHVALGTPFDYNSNPPTSGPHFATPAEWGVYTEEIHDQILVHNLEHGGILISYKPGANADVIAKLEVIAKEYGRKLIMTPRAANDTEFALAAWNHLDKFSAAEFSEERVRNFIRTYRNKGPEFVP